MNLFGAQWSRRTVNLVGFVICVLLMAYALISQHQMGLEPCPLCVFQRIGVIALGVVFLLAALHNPGPLGSRVYSIAGLLAAVGGGSVAARHVWLQHLPEDEVPACGPGLNYMLDVFPLTDVLTQVFAGSGECADVDWTFLGLSMPEWVLLWFVLLGLVVLVNGFRAVRA